jgi:cupin 2 domain-containing protein
MMGISIIQDEDHFLGIPIPLMTKGNIFADIPNAIPTELFETIAASPSVRIERIISGDHSSPPDFWYDQEHNEWVILLQGSAQLSFMETGETRILKPGDYVTIPAHVKHRVDWTDASQATVWLAVHYS